jgi:hypothetical protein
MRVNFMFRLLTFGLNVNNVVIFMVIHSPNFAPRCQLQYRCATAGTVPAVGAAGGGLLYFAA